ncbi:hypothetical protein MTY_1995 [Moorella thermoacetica Y72]|uniref:Uncharacterized protein n=1 Tax=Moorella thermoacetica Y72 TaxID=1325331 RepID=A0A0S6UDW3_NEOTH|nr:hypothetical protein MTY_1995 [Moorella thermoacetica Y72]
MRPTAAGYKKLKRPARGLYFFGIHSRVFPFL